MYGQSRVNACSILIPKSNKLYRSSLLTYETTASFPELSSSGFRRRDSQTLRAKSMSSFSRLTLHDAAKLQRSGTEKCASSPESKVCDVASCPLPSRSSGSSAFIPRRKGPEPLRMLRSGGRGAPPFALEQEPEGGRTLPHHRGLTGPAAAQ